MEKICFFNTKSYDRKWFDYYNKNYEIEFYESRLNKNSAILASGSSGIISFVNDNLDKDTIDVLYDLGIKVIALRCAGYNHVDLNATKDKIKVLNVPSYSPSSVAEYAIGMFLTLNRKIHKAYTKTRDYNFSLNGMVGFDLKGKTIGIIGTGKIGEELIDICKGFKMNVIAYDLYPKKDSDIQYVDLNTLLNTSDIISLHCPLTEDTKYLINEENIRKMKKGVYIINTSRGELIETDSLISALKNGFIGGACLDVYEGEKDFFYEDKSDLIKRDDKLSALVSMPNVILTSHQAFLTDEALKNIAKTTIQNLDDFYDRKELKNEVKIKG
ncbi:2-hydroxyacid dehydrogenase [Anaerofustis stercorihominis]|uniref:2-hydroxyacid dehydrogenase n=1 Tax=Anaerofustis stercorihominis TaxID=214853 RepID=UPI00214C0701|nr:2-hydroxyacid dehydrogenase [Anaerofustis stercorihominis]MCR2033416.1 2-hydroxyacid dehydrogenase [Anaerofustis stercorihominis]